MDITLLLIAAAMLAASGLVGLLGAPGRNFGQHAATALTLAGAAVGLAGVVTALAGGGGGWSMPWRLPLGSFRVAVDGLSAAFLLPVLVVPALGAIYGTRYWRESEHPESGRGLRLFYGLLAGAMVVLVIARDGVLFFIAWEVMALAAFFLVTADGRSARARRAGWVYLLATHLGTMCLVAMFALLYRLQGSFDLERGLAAAAAPGTAIFVLAAVGFGLKAGIVPLHVWLPEAHANAPSHVSAVMSGVMLKMGIYGLMRVSGLFDTPPGGWGLALLLVGAAGGVLAIALALAEQDLKRLLAYSSIENVGIITAGLGLALMGRAADEPAWVALGLGGAVLHVWNHALFKPLLFFASGAVIHAAGTRELDRMGGLARRMPASALAFLTGAVAICALPPLNGFVSELAIYLGLFSAAIDGRSGAALAAAAAVPALAVIGSLALATFVKAYGVAFLGEPRTEEARQAHEAPPSMLVPVAMLAAGCAVVGVAPALAAPLLDRAIAAWAARGTPLPTFAALAPLAWTSGLACTVFALGTVGVWLLRRRMRQGAIGVPTWDCGYAAPTSRMQYTASSFAQMLVHFFAWALRPQRTRPQTGSLFPAQARFESRATDVFLERAALPAFRGAAALLVRLQLLERHRTQLHILFILATALVLLAVATH